jgi:hypothetical protein
VEELEHRLEHAMSAQTTRELAGLLRDLPALAPPIEPPSRATVRVGPPGVRPFTYRFVVRSSLDRTRAAALDTIATALTRNGWELLPLSATSLEFKRTRNERITIELEPNGSTTTTIIVHGRAPWSVRRQFARLLSH